MSPTSSAEQPATPSVAPARSRPVPLSSSATDGPGALPVSGAADDGCPLASDTHDRAAQAVPADDRSRGALDDRATGGDLRFPRAERSRQDHGRQAAARASSAPPAVRRWCSARRSATSRRGAGSVTLPELFRFQSWLTAREVLLLHCRLLRPADAAQWDAMVSDALATVGLSDRGDDKVGSFSKGMQQRLGLGVALLGEPELVVLDEPTSALDPVGRHQVREIIRDLRARGTTVFLNTHLLEEVEHVCDRVAVIDRGQTIATGTLAELIGQQSSVRLQVVGPR